MWSDEELEGVLEGVSRLGWLVLKRFSSVYRPSDILAAFTSLSSAEFESLRRLSFALSDELSHFMEENAPRFVRVLPSASVHSLEERSGPPRGRIDWQRTFIKQSHSGSDPTQFVTRSIERNTDTTGARLFSFLLHVAAENAGRLLRYPIPDLARTKLDEQVHTAKALAAVLKGRGVRECSKLTARELAPLRKSRSKDVLAAVALYDLYGKVVEQASENLLRELLQRKQFAPENHDDLFEVWTLLTLVENHIREGWQVQEAVLIGGATSPRRPKFLLVKDSVLAELFFQTIPTEMGKHSSYKAIFAEYTLDASQRRPDITIKVTWPDGRVQKTIVEVKRTRDPGYILDSVYKTLGYLADFRQEIGPDSPLAILVVWGGIQKLNASTSEQPIQIVTASELPLFSLPY